MERGKIALGAEYLRAYGTDWRDDEARWERVRVVDLGPFLAAESVWKATVTLPDAGVDVRAEYWMREGDPDRKRDRSVKYGVAVQHLTFTGEATGRHEIVGCVDLRHTWAEHLERYGARVQKMLDHAAARAETADLAARAGVEVIEGTALPYSGREDFVVIRRPLAHHLLRLAAGLGMGES